MADGPPNAWQLAPSASRAVTTALLLLGLLPFWLPTGAAAAGKDTAEVPDDTEATHPLPKRYADWLDMVDALITDLERAYFGALGHNFRRDAFIERFWKERDPDTLTHRNELRYFWEEHADLARVSYETLLDGRAVLLMLKGEPFTRCLERTREQETWYYELNEEEVFPVTVYSNISGRPYKIYKQYSVFNPGLRRAAKPMTLREMCGGVNPELMSKEVTRRYRGGYTYAEALERFLEPPPDPSKEWVASFDASTSDLPSGVETFDLDFEVTFPGYYQQRTVVEGIAIVPPGLAGTLDSLVTVDSEVGDGEVGDGEAGSGSPPAAPLEVGLDGSTYQFRLTGEVVRGDELFDQFHYNFELPATPGSPPAIPLIFQRYLRPGPATLMLKVEDLFARRFARVEQDIVVPRVTKAADVRQLADTELMRQLAEANAAAARGERILRLVAPQRTVMTGLVRFKTFDAGEFHRVSFFLDEKNLLTKRKPPYSVELDLGDTPIPHLLRVSGFDENGAEVARDELQLNPGGQRFRVRLTEPRSGEKYRRSIPVRVDVQTPDDKPIDRVELFIDEDRVATLYQPPYSQPILLPEEGALVYVRAVAYMTDGNSTEDVVFINAPDYLEEIDVQMVEVYATVHDGKGQPVLGLEEAAFKVTEDGAQQTLRRFDWVQDLPIHAGLLLDVSASMEESLETVTTAARGFVEQAIQPQDRLALLTFNERPDVVQRFTNDVTAVQNSLAALRADGGTA
ncbi:MAG: VWA domain-containing protein, partial [Acidobacteriota bacterium]